MIVCINPNCLSPGYRAAEKLAYSRGARPLGSYSEKRQESIRAYRSKRRARPDGPSALLRRKKRVGLKPASVRRAEADAKFASMRAARPA